MKPEYGGIHLNRARLDPYHCTIVYYLVYETCSSGIYLEVASETGPLSQRFPKTPREKIIRNCAAPLAHANL
jgi:hypothetical protein